MPRRRGRAFASLTLTWTSHRSRAVLRSTGGFARRSSISVQLAPIGRRSCRRVGAAFATIPQVPKLVRESSSRRPSASAHLDSWRVDGTRRTHPRSWDAQNAGPRTGGFPPIPGFSGNPSRGADEHGICVQRLDPPGGTPVAVNVGFSYAGNKNNGVRAGAAGEFRRWLRVTAPR